MARWLQQQQGMLLSALFLMALKQPSTAAAAFAPNPKCGGPTTRTPFLGRLDMSYLDSLHHATNNESSSPNSLLPVTTPPDVDTSNTRSFAEGDQWVIYTPQLTPHEQEIANARAAALKARARLLQAAQEQEIANNVRAAQAAARWNEDDVRLQENRSPLEAATATPAAAHIIGPLAEGDQWVIYKQEDRVRVTPPGEQEGANAHAAAAARYREEESRCKEGAEWKENARWEAKTKRMEAKPPAAAETTAVVEAILKQTISKADEEVEEAKAALLEARGRLEAEQAAVVQAARQAEAAQEARAKLEADQAAAFQVAQQQAAKEAAQVKLLEAEQQAFAIKAAQQAKDVQEARAKLEAEQAFAIKAAQQAKDVQEARAKLEAEQAAALKAAQQAKDVQEARAKLEAEQAAAIKAAQQAKDVQEARAKLEAEQAAALKAAQQAKDVQEAQEKLEAEQAAALKAAQQAKTTLESRVHWTTGPANALQGGATTSLLLHDEQAAVVKGTHQANLKAEQTAALNVAQQAKDAQEAEEKLEAEQTAALKAAHWTTGSANALQGGATTSRILDGGSLSSPHTDSLMEACDADAPSTEPCAAAITNYLDALSIGTALPEPSSSITIISSYLDALGGGGDSGGAGEVTSTTPTTGVSLSSSNQADVSSYFNSISSGQIAPPSTETVESYLAAVASSEVHLYRSGVAASCLSTSWMGGNIAADWNIMKDQSTQQRWYE